MGVEVKVTRPGNGKDFPKSGDAITVHYVGKLPDGKTFDSSIDRGHPFVTKIGIGQVVKGWDVAFPKISLGEEATLTISGDYGYGERGFPNLIPPNSTLLFYVELLAINDKKAGTAGTDGKRTEEKKATEDGALQK